MADLLFQSKLAGDGAFQSRCQAALVSAAVAVAAETTNETQRITVTGTPTGGTFTLATLPGSVTTVQTGTLTSAATTCTGLASTVGMFVGMSITGTNVPAGTTVAAIVSATAVTLSANASGSGAQTLTFSGTPVTVVNFNATYADVQAALQALSNIGMGNVVCSGGPLPGTPVDVTFAGTLGNTPLKLITVAANGLTGGSSPAAAVTRQVPGVAFALHTQRMAQVARALYGTYDLYRLAQSVAANATVAADFVVSGSDIVLANGKTETGVASDIQFVINGNWNAFN